MAYTYTPGTSATTGNVFITSTGYGTVYTNSSPYTIATSTGPTWTNLTNGTSTGASIQVKGDAEFEGKVKINGQDLAETLKAIQDRLAILVPDPKLLDKYEALKQAYEHYKTLEALCVDEDTTS
jgi:hypothetical protein